jgi:hypothetical protein
MAKCSRGCDLSFPSAAQHIALQEYRDAIGETELRIDRLTEQLRQLAPTTWRWAPVVKPSSVARSLVYYGSEPGRRTRGPDPLSPSARADGVSRARAVGNSSGPWVRRGTITKAGSPHALHLLAEACRHTHGQIVGRRSQVFGRITSLLRRRNEFSTGTPLDRHKRRGACSTLD